MLSLDKLSIKGFKSFVEPTEFEIKSGLTGIVGPNGCGKSNIVEAIRFGLGEVSAKQLRGKEIDDLIFNGTDIRTSWNLAEVGLFVNIDGTDLENKFESKSLEIARWRGSVGIGFSGRRRPLTGFVGQRCVRVLWRGLLSAHSLPSGG